VGTERADAQQPVAPLDIRQSRQAGDVDEELRRRQSQVERRDQALAAGEDLRAGALEEIERLR
jgi:hypothetical protein